MHLRNRRCHRRPGAILVETVLILAVFYLILTGMIVMGLGVFRYQMMATMAREGARYASVHGAQYQQDTGNAAASASDVYNNAILPLASGLNTANLTYSVTWDDPGKAPTYVPANPSTPGQAKANNVTVTVTYVWVPEMNFGQQTLSSTSVMPMSY